jgi:hypothetical protein
MPGASDSWRGARRGRPRPRNRGIAHAPLADVLRSEGHELAHPDPGLGEDDGVRPARFTKGQAVDLIRRSKESWERRQRARK